MQQISADCALIVFLRLPIKGHVKTRIASVLGEDHALEIYKELMAVTLDLAAQMDVPVYLFFEGGLPVEAERIAAYTYHLQAAGDLGTKMAAALSLVLPLHRKAVLIGSDCPGLSTTILYQAFSMLDESDIILGPASDGGYYLIGCRKVHPALFERITWSTSSVLMETIDKIQEEKLTCRLLDQLTDIDTAEDWDRYHHRSTAPDDLMASV